MDAQNPSTRQPHACRVRVWLAASVIALWATSIFAQAPVITNQRMGGGDQSIIRQIAPNTQEFATHYERTGRTREATALYEDLARTNSSARKILSSRLVTTYTETGETNKVLTRAHEVMRDNPDPQPYLAAVQARLGQWPEVRKLLEQEITGSTNATRVVALRWQLAELFEKTGDNMSAGKFLNEADAAASGTAMETTARRRLNAVKQAP